MAGKRRRFKDVYNLGRSSTVPFMQGEHWKERHARRMREAFNCKGVMEEWCKKHRWRFRIENNGYHWIFNTQENKMIEWFPSTGKLGVGKQWSRTFHCHDVNKLIELFEETLKK